MDPPEAMAEIGQQVAWLGAALRTSPFESGIVLCTPAIRSTQSIGAQRRVRSNTKVYIIHEIGFDMSTSAKVGSNRAGQCWHSMFRNRVMVKGYPIPRRQQARLGIEMPLNMMAKLVDTKQANEYNSRLFIKGFSAKLGAVRVTSGLLLWHYVYNQTGEKILYCHQNSRTALSDNIRLSQTDEYRHVVGWCEESSFMLVG
jgi:hypothetical protein